MAEATSTLAARPHSTSAAARRAVLNGARTQQWIEWWLTWYVVLWLIDGALRKWVAPGLSDLIYFAKDGATLVAFALVLVSGVPSARVGRMLTGLGCLLALGALVGVQAIVTVQPLLSLMVGFVTYASPIAAVAMVATLEPSTRLLNRVIGLVLAILPVQAGLTMIQTLTPDTSFWNRTGDAGNVGLYTTGEVVRATGTFISPSGLSAYVALCAALLAARLIGQTDSFRWQTLVPLTSVVVVVALGGSRGAVLGAIYVLLGTVWWTFAGRGFALGRLGRLAGSILALYGLLRLAIALFPGVTRAFRERFEQAADEDSRLRLLDSTLGYLETFGTVPYWGDGLGSHTLSGIAAGSPQGWIEEELNRWAAEFGVLGVALAVARQLFAIGLLFAAWRAARRCGDPLVGLVSLVFVPPLIYGAITAPASQSGFAVTLVAILFFAWPRGVGQADKVTGGRTFRTRVPAGRARRSAQ